MFDERTKEWRNIVENVEKRREELGLSIPPKDKSRILAGSVSHIRAMARIVETVAGLDKLLKEQRSAYLAAHGGEYHSGLFFFCFFLYHSGCFFLMFRPKK